MVERFSGKKKRREEVVFVGPRGDELRRYYGTCTNPSCPCYGDMIDLGGNTPSRAPVCDGCNEELTVHVSVRKAS